MTTIVPSRTPQTTQTASWRLWAVFAFTLVAGILSLWMFLQAMGTSVPASWGTPDGPRSSGMALANTLQQTLISPTIICLFGVLIVARQPGNRIGRLLLFFGPVLAFIPLSAELTIAGFYRADPVHPSAYFFALVSNTLWIFPYVALIWCMAIFPDGRFLSAWWRGAILFSLLLFCGPSLIATMTETPLSSGYQVPNILLPNTSDTLSWLIELCYAIAVPFMLISVVLALLSLFARYRRSETVVRQQIKWSLIGLLVMAVTLGVGLTLSFGEEVVLQPLGQVLVNLTHIFPVTGIGIAMLRYRLFDVDLLIRRSLTYALLTASLAGVYYLGIVVLQTLLGQISGVQDTPLITVVTTLGIAALFTPFRRRIQDFIDRRFYRAKYDAEQTLLRFSHTARDEVDIARLTQSLLSAVNESLQPEQTSLWIRDHGG